VSETPETPISRAAEQRPVKLPSKRAGAILAAVMLAVGVALGAAIGPAPDASLAGQDGFGKRLPLLLAEQLAARAAAAKSATTAPTIEPPAITPQATPAAVTRKPAKSSAAAPAAEEEATKSEAKEKTKKSTLPAITNVWLIELAGTGFEAAESQPAAAPYIDTQLIPAATFLGGWSALQAGAFATEAALAVPPAAGSSPPLLHSIVQPPCPEGAAGAACAPETPGQITAADDFLKSTLATITNTALYKEHGVIVITFASVGVASQSELPAGASTATLTYQPPAGAAVLSPFAKAGLRSKASFNATSPRQSLEALLH